MTTLLLLAALICPNIQFFNETAEPWTPIDIASANRAINRCPELYPDSPCLLRFYKKQPGAYWAVCGGPK